MEQTETSLNASVKGLTGGLKSLSLCSVLRHEERLSGFEVNVTKLIKPEVVDSSRSTGQIVALKAGVGLSNGVVKAAEDPTIDLGGMLWKKRGTVAHGWLKVGAKLGESKADGIPDLVAEVTIANNTIDIEVDITTLSSV